MHSFKEICNWLNINFTDFWRLGSSVHRTFRRWIRNKGRKLRWSKQRWRHTASLPYLEAVIGPTTEFQNAGLLVKGEILYVYLTRRLVNGRRFPLDQPLVVDDCLGRQHDLEVAVRAVGGEKQQHTDWGRLYVTSLGHSSPIQRQPEITPVQSKRQTMKPVKISQEDGIVKWWKVFQWTRGRTKFYGFSEETTVKPTATMVNLEGQKC